MTRRYAEDTMINERAQPELAAAIADGRMPQTLLIERPR